MAKAKKTIPREKIELDIVSIANLLTGGCFVTEVGDKTIEISYDEGNTDFDWDDIIRDLENARDFL